MTGLQPSIWSWLALAIVVGVSLTADLLLHRGPHGCGRRQAVIWTVVWIALAVAFGGWIAFELGAHAAGQYFTAWTLEKSLSLDNLFVFLLVFRRLRIPETEQHRVLFWGILGALVTRGAFIAGGIAALDAWKGALYVMGAFLILTGLRAALDEPSKDSRVLDFLSRHLPLTRERDGHRFFTKVDGRRVATPLLLALAVIEISDVIFAVDSIPAVLAISRESFIAYASNVFAILGLRALYLVVAGPISRLRYLRFGLGAILVLVGAKMVLARLVEVPPLASLAVLASILGITVVASVAAPGGRRARRA